MARNKLCFEQKETPQELIISRSDLALEIFRKVRRIHGGREPTEVQESRKEQRGWKPPQGTNYKLNTDATKMGDNMWDLGAIITDGEGNIMLAAKVVFLSLEPKVAEALAMRFSL